MIIYINGNIGSGKTGLAVAFIYAFFPNKIFDKLNNFVKKFFPNISGIKKDKKKIYTNISGFKFEDFEGKAEFLNFDILSQCAKIHHEIHLTNKDHKHIDKAINSFFDQVAHGVEFDDLETDLKLTKISRKYDYIKGFQFNHIILLIDEVADYFVEGEPHLDKWFNYSRHLFQDMILIQNDLSTIDKSYKNDNVVSYYIKAAEASNRLHPQLFKYAFFRKWTQPSTDKPSIKMFYIPKWIFEKYDSGQAEKAFPKIYLYLIPFIFLLIFVINQIYVLFFSEDELSQVEAKPSTDLIKPNIINNQTKFKSKKNEKIVCFKCRNDICFYENDIFTFNKLGAYIDIYEFTYKYHDDFTSFSNYCFSVPNSFTDLYQPLNKSKIQQSKGFSPLDLSNTRISQGEI